MRNASRSIILTLASLLLVSMGVVALANPSPLVGSWTGVEPDGSEVHITIGGDGHFHLRDNGGQICEDEGLDKVPVTLNGTGEFEDEGQTLHTDSTTILCYTRDGHGVVEVGETEAGVWTYDAANDNLLTPDCYWRTGSENDC
jgi:hypothetical protein